MKDRYTFGDNDRAADRLTLLARAFAPSSAHLLERVRPSRPPRVVDLGCGPGYTTALARRALGARETWGLDASERLVARARAEFGAGSTHGDNLEFGVHDVTKSPLPVSGVDVFYARYLLTHLAEPRTVLDACAGAASGDSQLVLEDNCSLESKDPLFAAYYERVRTMHAHYGQDMFVGERLPEIAAGTPWAVVGFERTRIDLDGRVMAQLHALNVRTWRNDPFAIAAFDAKEIDAMAGALDDVANGVRSAPQVTCMMGQA
ncbi:MAG TPA: class I SAM-dependent methyltransferase, partial [Polyangiaceae bacterium]|nr:class I SAM-dependent methyltransferase [Polyangiaceae bacterium]